MAEVAVSLAPPAGMISLRGDLADEALRAAVADVADAVPGRLALAGGLARGAAWMSPDELLLFVPREEVASAMARLGGRLAGAHHLVADVSDLRAVIRLDGPPGDPGRAAVREVLAKLTPADLHPDAFGPGAFRRSRLGQVAAAFWLEGQGAHVLCFRSVGGYLLDLLGRSAADGPVGFHSAD